MITQHQKILSHCEKYDSINTKIAYSNYGISRLSARIFELQKMGFVFEKKTVKVPSNYDSGKTHVTEYRLVGIKHEDQKQ